MNDGYSIATVSDDKTIRINKIVMWKLVYTLIYSNLIIKLVYSIY